MDDNCLEVLSKIEKCINDPDFQMILIMKFIRSLSPYLKTNGENNERNK